VGKRAQGKQYRIYSFVTKPDISDTSGSGYSNDSDYVIRAENFGVPQARHRVILLGVCTDIRREPEPIKPLASVAIEHVLTGLPQLRSKLSKSEDSPEEWERAIRVQATAIVRELGRRGPDAELARRIESIYHALNSGRPTESRERGHNP